MILGFFEGENFQIYKNKMAKKPTSWVIFVFSRDFLKKKSTQWPPTWAVFDVFFERGEF